MKDYYGILDVTPGASPEEIRKAFRTLAFMCHPDLAGSDCPGPDAFIEIREAYEVLAGEESRRRYDAELAVERQREAEVRARPQRVKVERQAARQAYSPRFTEQRLRTPLAAEVIPEVPAQRSPFDLMGAIEISLEETLRPTIVTVVLPSDDGSEAVRRIQVRLPGQMYPGIWLRVAGQGNLVGAQRGELFVEVLFASHPSFRLCSQSLFHDLPVSPWHAALGFEAVVPTLEGFERVPVPPMLSTPHMRRLPGKGIYRRDGERGDLWINLKLEVPPPTSYRARRLWAELAEEYRHGQRQNG